MRISKRRTAPKVKSNVKSHHGGGFAYPVIYGADTLLTAQERAWKTAVDSGLKPPEIDPDLASFTSNLSMVDRITLAAKFARWSAMLTDQVRHHLIYADQRN